MYSLFLLSFGNTVGSLEQPQKAVETQWLAHHSSHRISRSSKLPLVFQTIT